MRLQRLGIVLPGIESVLTDKGTVNFRNGVSGDVPDAIAKHLIEKRAAIPFDPTTARLTVPLGKEE